jgi:hypothetical protein
MSFNQIYDTPPHNTPIDKFKDVKFNNVRCNTINDIIPVVGSYPVVSMYNILFPYDINGSSPQLIAFDLTPVYNNLVGQITKVNSNDFRCDTTGTYLIELVLNVRPSTSRLVIEMRKNTTKQTSGGLEVSTTSLVLKAILVLAVNDIINFRSIRVVNGVDTAPKLTIGNLITSPLTFTRIA